jgi:diadenosine tetraphosphate (Ap4A) HIT family hydrolase
MPETPEQLHARVAGALRMPPVEEWDTFPFDGDLRPRTLLPPVRQEKPRHGIDGIGCWACERPDDAFLWSDEHWRLTPLEQPSGLPVVVLLYPRRHYDLDTLPRERSAELGPLIQRIERAVRTAGEIGRVHVCRWGDGGEHLHWWFMARPARIPQLIGNFAAIWDDILPPTPEDVWRENLAIVARELVRE